MTQSSRYPGPPWHWRATRTSLSRADDYAKLELAGPSTGVASTAAKYSSDTTLRRYTQSQGASLTCSTPVGDTLARGSGRRGRRFKSCHPDQCSRRPEALPLPGWGLRFGPYRNEVPQRCSSKGLPQPAQRFAGRGRAGVRIVFQACLAPTCRLDPADLHQQTHARPGRPGSPAPAAPGPPMPTHQARPTPTTYPTAAAQPCSTTWPP
jgi:hypothetical protein